MALLRFPEPAPVRDPHRARIAAFVRAAAVGAIHEDEAVDLILEAEPTSPPRVDPGRITWWKEMVRANGNEDQIPPELLTQREYDDRLAKAWDAGWQEHAREEVRQRHDPTHPIARTNPYRKVP